MSIEVRNISKKFGKFPALKASSPRVFTTGQLVAPLGPSGSGKNDACCGSSRGTEHWPIRAACIFTARM